MDERYTDRHISEIFSADRRRSLMLRVAVSIMTMTERLEPEEREAVSHFMSHASELPVYDKLKREAARMEAEMGHDVAAFAEAVKVVATGASYAAGAVFRSKFHLRSTSSDVVDTVLAAQLQDAFAVVGDAAASLMADYDLRASVITEGELRFNGRTHGRIALPITGAERWGRMRDDLKSWWRPANRDIKGKLGGPVGNCYTAREVQAVAADLGLCLETGNARQCASRHSLARNMQSLASLAGILENHATYLRLHMVEGVDEYEISRDQGYVGSSSMHWKSNPTQLERVCGMARLVRGYCAAINESTNLWHERDISHSCVERVAIPDAFHCVTKQLSDMGDVMRRLSVVPGSVLGAEPTGQELELQKRRESRADAALK